jgi:hypothetical protein
MYVIYVVWGRLSSDVHLFLCWNRQQSVVFFYSRFFKVGEVLCEIEICVGIDWDFMAS